MAWHDLILQCRAASMLRATGLLVLAMSGATPTGADDDKRRHSTSPDLLRYGLTTTRRAASIIDASAPKTGRKPLPP